MKKNSIYYLFLLSTTVILTMVMAACTGEPVYPRLLVEADSAYVAGDYSRGDSLLSEYVNHPVENKDDYVDYYFRLVRLERCFVKGHFPDTCFSLIDSLCRYYDRKDIQEKYAKALLFMGEIYYENDACPEAIECLLKAEEQLDCKTSTVLRGWISQKMGDVYFSQHLYNECSKKYREFYHISVSNRDTLRMAHAANRMGKVCTIENKIDSTIYYYKQSINLASNLSQWQNIVPFSRKTLCDIYNQIEEYDSAKILLTRKEEDDVNWAYWHYGQNHKDSAVYYFKKSLGRFNWYGEIEILKILVSLEKEKGNIGEALYFSERLAVANDSLRLQSQTALTSKVNNQHEYNSMKHALDEKEIESKRNAILQIVGAILIIVLFLFVWKIYKEKRNAELEREKRLLKEEEERHRQSLQTMEQNKQRIKELEIQLVEARKMKDQSSAMRLQLDSEALVAENNKIEALQRRSTYLVEEFMKSPTFLKIKRNSGNAAFSLSETDIQLLGKGIDEAYNQFTKRLFDRAELKGIELHVCYLIKMNIQPYDISLMLGRSKSGITMICQRLLWKLAHRKGTTKDFQTFMKDF